MEQQRRGGVTGAIKVEDKGSCSFASHPKRVFFKKVLEHENATFAASAVVDIQMSQHE